MNIFIEKPRMRWLFGGVGFHNYKVSSVDKSGNVNL